MRVERAGVTINLPLTFQHASSLPTAKTHIDVRLLRILCSYKMPLSQFSSVRKQEKFDHMKSERLQMFGSFYVSIIITIFFRGFVRQLLLRCRAKPVLSLYLLVMYLSVHERYFAWPTFGRLLFIACTPS